KINVRINLIKVGVRKAGCQQAMVKVVAIRNMNRRTVQISTARLPCREAFFLSHFIHYPYYQLLPVHKRYTYREYRYTLYKVSGAIQRVDYPDIFLSVGPR